MTDLSTMNSISDTNIESSPAPFIPLSAGFSIGTTIKNNNPGSRRRPKNIRASINTFGGGPSTYKNNLPTYYTILEKIVWGSFRIICNYGGSFNKQLDQAQPNQQIIIELGCLQYVLLSYFTTIISDKAHSITDKYIHLLEVQSNNFISDSKKDTYMDFIMTAQKHNIALNRFAFICKYKLAKVGCTTDMYLTQINEQDPNTITLLHGGRKYSFTIPDLKKIISTSLNNRFNLYAEPLPCKNPYNNLPFSKSDLYTIYFKLKASYHSIPPVFQQYFESDFILTKLINKYEQPMRENAMLINAQSLDTDELVDEILQMIKESNDNTRTSLNIDDDFPSDVLIKTFQPYLKYYHRSVYSLSSSVKEKNRLYIKALMDRFVSHSPTYGRKIAKKITTLSGKNKFETIYIMNAPTFKSPVNYSSLYREGHENEINILSSYVQDYRRKQEFSRRQLFHTNLITNNNTQIFSRLAAAVSAPPDNIIEFSWQIDNQTDNGNESESESEIEETESVS